MAEFKRSGGYGDKNRGGGGFKRGGDRPSFGGRPSFGSKFGGRSDGPKTMHKAICAGCGKTCEVPFKPNGQKPVFCNDCFGDQRDENKGGSENKYEKRNFSEPRFPRAERKEREYVKPATLGSDLKKEIDALNAKLDKIIDMMKQGIKPKSPEKERDIPALLADIESTEGKSKKKSTKKVSAKKAKTKK